MFFQTLLKDLKYPSLLLPYIKLKSEALFLVIIDYSTDVGNIDPYNNDF